MKLIDKIPKQVRRIVAIALAIGPFVWILLRIDPQRMIGSLRDVAWWTVPVVLFTAISVMCLQGIRWWILMRAFVPSFPFGKAMLYHFAGNYYSLMLPTSAAQDFVRAALVSREYDYSVSWASMWVHKLAGFIGWALLSTIGIVFLGTEAQSPTVMISASLAGIILCAMVYLSFSKRFSAPIRHFTGRFVSSKRLKAVLNIRQIIYEYRDKKSHLISGAFLTILTQILLVSGFVVTLSGLSGLFLWRECFAYIPLIEIILISVPVTPNGSGIREGLTAIMLSNAGLSPEQVGMYTGLSILATGVKLLGIFPALLGSIAAPSKSLKKGATCD